MQLVTEKIVFEPLANSATTILCPNQDTADAYFDSGKQHLAAGHFELAERDLRCAVRLGTRYPAQAEYLLRSAVAAKQPREVLNFVNEPTILFVEA